MPTETFFNLPDEKRQPVLDAAIGEFTTHPFSQASVNRIVERAGISKGSFYQYFINKEDLFVHLVNVISEQKMGVLEKTIHEEEANDLFSVLRALYLGGLRFADQYPDYAAIGRNLLKEKDSPIYQRLVAGGTQNAIEYFRPMVENAIQEGLLRKNLDPHFVSYLIATLTTHITEYYDEFIDSSFDKRMLDLVDQLIDLLRYGLASA